MATEIERKFLVDGSGYRREASAAVHIRQGYLSMRPEATVRVRIKGERGYVTVKGITCGATRREWEYEVPKADAEAMLELCEGAVVDKVRYLVPAADGHVWEVDEFASPRPGLVVAEVELASESEPVELPEWVATEVTGNPQYYNSVLAQG